MKKIIIILCIAVGIISMSSCKEKAFIDKTLLDEWTLQWHEDVNQNKIHEKPNNLPQNIILVFRQDFSIGGQIASFSIDGTYTIDKEGAITLNIVYPELPLCCEWDNTFLKASLTASSYKANEYSNYLRINYDNGNKAMLFTK